MIDARPNILISKLKAPYLPLHPNPKSFFVVKNHFVKGVRGKFSFGLKICLKKYFVIKLQTKPVVYHQAFR